MGRAWHLPDRDFTPILEIETDIGERSARIHTNPQSRFHAFSGGIYQELSIRKWHAILFNGMPIYPASQEKMTRLERAGVETVHLQTKQMGIIDCTPDQTVLNGTGICSIILWRTSDE
jgi:hypothetical protein